MAVLTVYSHRTVSDIKYCVGRDDVSTRHYAQLLVEKVIAYRQSHGRYPATAQALGYSDAQIRELFVMGGYFLTDGKPYLFYASTYMPFESESYDFALRQWQHQGR